MQCHSAAPREPVQPDFQPSPFCCASRALLGERTDGISANEASQKAITAINILSKDVGIPDGLVALGKKYGKKVREEDIPIMTANAQKDACALTNPRIMSDEAVTAIYKAAL